MMTVETVVLTLLVVMVGAFIGCLLMIYLLSENPGQPPPETEQETEPEPDPALDYFPEEWMTVADRDLAAGRTRGSEEVFAELNEDEPGDYV